MPIDVNEDIEMFHLVESLRVVLLDVAPGEWLAVGCFMLDSLKPLGDEGALLGFLQRRAHSVAASGQKGDFLTGLTLGVGDFVHVLCDKIANVPVGVSVLIAERVGDGLPGDIRGGGVGLAFEGVLHDVHLQGVSGHVGIKPGITC